MTQKAVSSVFFGQIRQCLYHFKAEYVQKLLKTIFVTFLRVYTVICLQIMYEKLQFNNLSAANQSITIKLPMITDKRSNVLVVFKEHLTHLQ